MAPVGARLIDHAPLGHWHTQTPDHVRGRLFIAGLAHDGLIAPWVLDGAMNRASFEAYVTHELAPALQPGQIVVTDNLSSRKSAKVIDVLRAQDNDLIFLPPYSPDLNPCMDAPAWQGVCEGSVELVGCGHVFGVSVQRVRCAP